MKAKEKNKPLNEVRYKPEEVGLNNLIFNEPNITLMQTATFHRHTLPLEVRITDIKKTPGTYVLQTKNDQIHYPVTILEGSVLGGKFKGVIRAEKFVIANHVISNCQIHFYLEKEGKAYAGKSMDHLQDKNHLTAAIYLLKEKLEPDSIGTDYHVHLPFFRVMRAYFEPAKK